MKSLTVFLVAVLGVFVLAGCSEDKSGATQSMPPSASAPNGSPTPGNLPKQAQDAISKAAPGAKPR